ncbi:phage major capsid protein, P2 family [Burkholderia vietnamiensis]|uniref:phage major capsid protein, P2 family n=1 Tax=Burkholderia vietnamiensis TaxID=60552 RepID=UPI001BA08178|nr:phage major capsid protein, P2 family [Burkholderia vietnamiensis]MBR8361669.1 phage major capsid protein, P2 family [Burkholderia vietnamiensis]
MNNETRLQFNAFLDALDSLDELHKLNVVDGTSKQFAVVPSAHQLLETRIRESSAFLSLINLQPVDEPKGSKLGLGVGGPVASTVDTVVKDREPIDYADMDALGYFCYQTNFDLCIPYAQLDAWAKFPGFQARLQDAITRRQALDRIMIGFNGTSRAATSDRVANPLLQDVNKGWLQHYREQAPQRVMNHGAAAGKVTVGAAGDYKNLDALVYAAKSTLLDPWYRQDQQLVAIVGAALMQDNDFQLVNRDNSPTDSGAADLMLSQRRVGGLMAASASFFPANSVLITRLDNLSIYYQERARRRSVSDNAARDRIESFESSLDAYVVEDFGAGCLIENVEILA